MIAKLHTTDVIKIVWQGLVWRCSLWNENLVRISRTNENKICFMNVNAFGTLVNNKDITEYEES